MHDFDILIELDEAAVIACLACGLEEIECLFDIELAGT